MIDLRPVLAVIGLLLSVLAVGMAVPAVFDLLAGHTEWQAFALSAGITLFSGQLLYQGFRGSQARFTIRQTFLLTTLAWLVLTTFAGLPFLLSDLNLDVTDAFFEAMSGITTTGSTVIVGLNHAPPGILLWRAVLQWLGGIGIIVMAVAVMPLLQVGGMQLFRTESSDRSEKVMPRVAQIAAAIAAIYVGLTFLCAFALWLAGLEVFHAVAHAMTTLATGGFSTMDASVGHFDLPAVEYIVIVGMLMGGMPFVLYLRTLKGDLWSLARDSQVRVFLAIVFLAALLMTLYAWQRAGLPLADAVRLALFNVTSVITGTGYASTDYGAWGPFAITVFFFLMFIGGCAGSTTCGIKIFRFQVLYATARQQLQQLLHPRGVFIPYYNKKPIPAEVSGSVLGFFFLFVASFVLLTAALGLLGLDFLTSVSGAATALANVGPGLGALIGPSGNFAHMPDGAKWLLSAGMLLGRLELFTIMVLILPSFWRE